MSIPTSFPTGGPAPTLAPSRADSTAPAPGRGEYDAFLSAKLPRVPSVGFTPTAFTAPLFAFICPLQLDVIRRGLQLWSNPGDVVLSPFMGIGSEGYVAVEMGRRFIGAELKPSYYRVAVENLRRAEQRIGGGLFADVTGEEVA